MGFSGARAIILIVVLVALVAAIKFFGLPWLILPVGLLVAAQLLKGAEKKSEGK